MSATKSRKSSTRKPQPKPRRELKPKRQASGPRDVACPACRAKPGSPCKRPSGHAVFGGQFHNARVMLANTPAGGVGKRTTPKPQPKPSTYSIKSDVDAILARMKSTPATALHVNPAAIEAYLWEPRNRVKQVAGARVTSTERFRIPVVFAAALSLAESGRGLTRTGDGRFILSPPRPRSAA